MKNYFNSKMILLKKILKAKDNIILDKNIPEFKKINTIAKKN